jgi:Peptidase family M48
LPAVEGIELKAMKNTFKTTRRLTALTVFLLLAGDYVGGRNGLLVAIIVAAVMNFVSYFYSDKIALALYRAKPLAPGQLPHLHHTVERLAQRAGLPMPKIYVIVNDSPHAFATGRDPWHASIAVTQGLLNLLSAEEQGRCPGPRTWSGTQPRPLDQFHCRKSWLGPSPSWPKWATGQPCSAALADATTSVNEAEGSRYC